MRTDALDATLAALPLDANIRTSLRGPSATIPKAPARSNTFEQHPPALDELPAVALEGTPEKTGDLSVLRTLGEGGMGKVVLASQRSLRRRVALKTAHDHVENVATLLHEGVITGMLEHPNIPPVHALNRDVRGRPVLVMKNIEGVTWADVLGDPTHPLRTNSPLFSGGEVVGNIEVLSHVCNALEFAHARGVIHRDVKPENVMLGAYGEVYLIDWGVAYHAPWNPGAERVPLVGTPTHMAPEMVAGEVPDARTDVYLLGATLHEVLLGKPPHHAANVRAAIIHAFESAPFQYAPDVPPDLAELCRHAMARAREQRLGSVREFRAALRSHLSHRASIVLCGESRLRFEELVALLRNPAHDPVAAARLQHECRFGYGQALREWPENPIALEGMRTVCRALAEHEIAQDNPRRARALLREMPDGDAQIERVVAELEARQQARAEAERTRIENERQTDIRNAQRERNAMSVAGLLSVFGVIAWRLFRPVHHQDLSQRHQSLLTLWLGTGTFVMVLVLAMWRVLSKHVVNRRWIRMLFIGMLCVAANRVAGVALLPGAAATLAGDLAIVSAIGLTSSMLISPVLGWGAVVCLLGIIPVLAFPARAGQIFNLTDLIAVATVIFGLRREVKQRERKARQT